MINYAPPATARVGVLGATGYTGRELTRLLLRHPDLGLAFASSEGAARLRLDGVDLELMPAARAAELEVDLVFCCLPTGEAGSAAREFADRGARVIDLSPDHRPPEGAGVYGLTELHRDGIRDAALVANPGCYPTGVALALAPLLARGLVETAGAIVVNAASGVTGAGRSPKPELLFAEVAGDFRAYGLQNGHRHLPEMRWALERASGSALSLVFTPHLLPVARGILETIHLPVRPGVSRADVAETWSVAYAGERFIEILGDRAPSLADAVGRNVVCLYACDVEEVAEPMVQVIVALDNLLKGASGQALQNANVMLGFDETLGLPA